MDIINTPHDCFFRDMMADIRVAKAFFQQHLPTELYQSINLESLSLCDGSYIEENLNKRMTDVLYRVNLLGDYDYCYLLTEHLSSSTRWMPLRIMHYTYLIKKRHISEKRTTTLPLVYPILLYHGKNPYPFSTKLCDMMNAPKALIDSYAYYTRPLQLIDLNHVEDDVLHQYTWAGMMQFVQKHIYAKNFLPWFKQVVKWLSAMTTEADQEFRDKVLYYIWHKAEIDQEEQFYNIAKEGLGYTRSGIMTLAEQSEARGFKRGIEKGVERGVGQGVKQGMKEGIKQGIEQGVLLTAKRLLANGMPTEVVAHATELSLTTIEQLRESA